jgi:hypothetical protein
MIKLIFIFFLISLPLFAQVDPNYKFALHNARSEYQFVWMNLDRYLTLAIQNTSIKTEERKVLVEILKNYKQEFERTKLEYISASANPEMFKITNGAHRVAVTDNKPFSTIYLNSDLIVDPKTGIVFPVENIVSIFVHELGHHLGLLDDSTRTLDRVGDIVATEFRNSATITDLAVLKLPDISILTQNMPLSLSSTPGFSLANIYIAYGFSGAQLTEQSLKLLVDQNFMKSDCSGNNSIVSTYAAPFRLSNLPTSKENLEGKMIQAMSDFTIVCKTNGILKKIETNLKMYFTLRFSTNRYYVDHTNIRFQLSSRDDQEAGSVDTIIFNKNIITKQDVWEGDATVTTDSSLSRFDTCKAGLSNDSFPLDSTQKLIALSFSKCEIVFLGNNKYKLHFSYNIPANIKSGQYYLSGLLLERKSDNTSILLQPPLRQFLTVKMADLKPVTVTSLKFLDSNEIDYSGLGLFNYQQGDEFTISITINKKIEDFSYLIFKGMMKTKDKKAHLGSWIYQNSPSQLFDLALRPTAKSDETEIRIKMKMEDLVPGSTGLWDAFLFNELSLLTSDYIPVVINFPTTFAIIGPK